MKTDNGCLQHLDALTEKSPLTPEALAHVKVCPACRQLAETLAALRQETTAWPTHDLSGLRQRVVARVRLETLPQSAAEPSRGERQPGPPPSVSWLDLLFAGRTVGYAAVFVCLMVVSALWLHPWQSKPLQTMSAQEFRLVRANGVTETRLVNEKIELASETADLHLPDGSVLAVVGPARVQAFARGFFIEQGVLRAMVKPGVVPFTGRTPHGEIIVLGTIFVCRVGEHQTEVQVEQGKVRIVSMRGPERVLVAGQKASMLYSAHAGTPGEIRENPAVESDPSQ